MTCYQLQYRSETLTVSIINITLRLDYSVLNYIKHTRTLFNRRSVNNNQLQPRSPSIYIRKFDLLCFALLKLRCIQFRTQTVCFSANHSSRCHPILPSQPISNPTKNEVIVRSTDLNRLDSEQRTLTDVICSSHLVIYQGKECAEINRIFIQIRLLICFNLP